MYITIQTSKMYDLSESYLENLAHSICSLALLNSIDPSVKNVGPNCRVIDFSSICLSDFVLQQRVMSIFRCVHDSLPSELVSDPKFFPTYCCFRFINFNIIFSLKS